MSLCIVNRDGAILGHRNRSAGPAPFLTAIAPSREAWSSASPVSSPGPGVPTWVPAQGCRVSSDTRGLCKRSTAARPHMTAWTRSTSPWCGAAGGSPTPRSRPPRGGRPVRSSGAACLARAPGPRGSRLCKERGPSPPCDGVRRSAIATHGSTARGAEGVRRAPHWTRTGCPGAPCLGMTWPRRHGTRRRLEGRTPCAQGGGWDAHSDALSPALRLCGGRGLLLTRAWPSLVPTLRAAPLGRGR